MSTGNLQDSFRATSIYPLNTDIIPETVFAPGTVTERPETNLNTSLESPSTSSTADSRKRKLKCSN